MAGRTRNSESLADELIGLKPHLQQDKADRRDRPRTVKRWRGKRMRFGRTRFPIL